MTEDEKDPGQDEGNIDHQDYTQAHPYRMVHPEVHHVYEWHEAETQDHEYRPPYKFPFPCDSQEYDQHKCGDEVHCKLADLLPERHSGPEGVEGKHADKQDRQDADGPGYPVENPDTCFHNGALLELQGASYNDYPCSQGILRILWPLPLFLQSSPGKPRFSSR